MLRLALICALLLVITLSSLGANNYYSYQRRSLRLLFRAYYTSRLVTTVIRALIDAMVPPKRPPQLVSAHVTPKKNKKAATSATPSSANESTDQSKKAIVSKQRKPPKSDEELKRNAIKSNPHGVKIYNANLENSKAVMAGYLGLADTNGLAELLSNDSEFDNCSYQGAANPTFRKLNPPNCFF